MASNLRRSKKTIGHAFNDTSKRVAQLQKRSANRRIAPGTVTLTNLSPTTTTALNNIELVANGAQLTADGKNTIFYQTSAPTANAVGDLWFDTDSTPNPNALYKSEAIGANTIAPGQWVLADINGINVSNINAGAITSGIISSIRIRGGTETPLGSGNYPFDVSSSGVLRAVSGTIGAFSLSDTTLTAGGLTGGTYETALIELATSGQIRTRINYNNGVGTSYYVDTYINKISDSGGINVEGTASGSFLTTKIRSSYIDSDSVQGREFSLNPGTTARYTSADTYVRFGDGDGTGGRPYSFRFETTSFLYNKSGTGRSVQVLSNGDLVSTTSSLRYKENIKDLSIDYRDVLKIQPVTFYYKKEMYPADVNQTLDIGVIAEQVESIGTLDTLLSYDDDDNTIVGSFRYDRLPVYLVEVCRKQEEMIENLQARVALLEGKK